MKTECREIEAAWLLNQIKDLTDYLGTARINATPPNTPQAQIVMARVSGQISILQKVWEHSFPVSNMTPDKGEKMKTHWYDRELDPNTQELEAARLHLPTALDLANEMDSILAGAKGSISSTTTNLELLMDDQTDLATTEKFDKILADLDTLSNQLSGAPVLSLTTEIQEAMGW